MGHPELIRVATPAAVHCADATLGYRGETVLAGVDGAFPTGSMTAVIGANGCGKSTLLKAIAGLVRPLAGSVTRRFRGLEVGYLPQADAIDRSFPVTVADFVAMGLWQQAGAFGAIAGARAARLQAALEAVGMRPAARHLIGELSGGQFQRMRFARLLLQDAQLLLLDEPFTGIDVRARTDLMHLLHDWHAAGRTLIVVLHDLDLVQREFPVALALGGQRLLAWGPAAASVAALGLHPPAGQPELA